MYPKVKIKVKSKQLLFVLFPFFIMMFFGFIFFANNKAKTNFHEIKTSTRIAAETKSENKN